jgi:rapamycin-insensitive companion of mTOR
MAGPASIFSSSATPTQRTVLSHAVPPRTSSNQATDTNAIRDGLQPPRAALTGFRSASNVSGVGYGPRGSSLAPSAIPGSFSSVLRSTVTPRNIASRPDLSVAMGLEYPDQDDGTTSERALADLKDKLNKEIKIKEGSENLLEALNTKKAKQTKDQRNRVEEELNSSNRKISQLKNEIEALQRPQPPPSSSRGRLSGLFRGNFLRPAAMNPSVVGVNRPDIDAESESESPTFTLAEILQSLETEGMDWSYYVERANNLVELLKRHPLLKYDLVWPVFGLRVQMMLLSDSKEVVAAGYRMTRYAITDRKSLQNIRELNTDYLVILSVLFYSLLPDLNN